jgi:hypothetical protein
MKASEFRKLIREEIKNVLKEATLIRKGGQTGAPADIKVNDYVQWIMTENERGMSVSKGAYIGKVVKVFGSRNLEVEVQSPSTELGDTYKVSKEECQRVPQVGEMISANVGYDRGAGSGSQGTSDITGTVAKVDIANQTISIKTEQGKLMKIKIRDLSNINTIR